MVERGADVVTWETATERWREYIRKTEGTSLVFEDASDRENRCYSQRSHRWSADYREREYAKLKDMERGIEDFYSRPWTGLLSLTASSKQVPNPVDHLGQLLDGRAAVLQALRDSLDGRTWDYWWVIEPHESGYAHLHVAVIVEGPVTEEQLRPAVDAHLRQVPAAGDLAHRDAISIQPGREIGNLAAYLNAYLGGSYGTNALDLPEHEQALAAVLWATGKRQIGASRRLRRFRKGDVELEDPESTWEFVAILDEDGDEHPVDPAEPGKVDRFVTEVRYPDPPPS